MSQLYFKKQFQCAIREGRKCTTIRRWDRPRTAGGRRAFSPGLGWLAIEAVEQIDLGALDDTDAQADGFDSLPVLLAVLRDLYPDSENDGKRWFRVRFSFEEGSPTVSAVAPAKKSKSATRPHLDERRLRLAAHCCGLLCEQALQHDLPITCLSASLSRQMD